MKRRPIFALAFSCLCAAAAEAAAQDRAGAPPPVRFSQLGGPCGLRQYVSSAWGVVGVEVVNAENQPVDVLAAFSFSRDPDLQFARRVTVPAQSVRRTWVPLKLPHVPNNRASIPCYGLLIDDRSGSEVVLRPAHEGIQHSVLLRVNHDKPVTGAFLEGAEEESADVDYAYEAVIALRTARGYRRGLVLISDRDVPPVREVFDGLDQIVLWNDRFASDVAMLSPLRGWLNDGGELWIMLDRVDAAGVERLLGDLFTCQVVDRVALERVRIESAEEGAATEERPAEQLEQPLDLVRVLVREMQVTHTVEGWPAAFWRPVGRGRVIFTTLDARAWIGRPPMLRRQWDAHRMTDYWPTPQLESLPLLRFAEPPLCPPEVFRDYLSERVGYRIASRQSVSGLLGLFCGALLLAGVGLTRWRRLEHLAWITPVLALATAVPLAALGWQAQRAVPAMVGEAQFIEVSEGADHLTGSGLVALYDPGGASEPLGAARGGMFEPEDAAAGSTQRMVWTDVDQWHWEHRRPTSGVWTAAFRWSGELPQRLAVRGTFSDAGFVANWTDASLALTDALLAIPAQPYLAVQVDGARLVAGPGDVLPAGRYVADGWLSDEQRRRQALLNRLLAPAAGKGRQVQRPMLLAWGEPLDLGFQFPPAAQRFGTAWWSIPVQLDRPSPGTHVVIPSPFVTFRAFNRLDSRAASSLYDYRTGEWVVSQKPSGLWLRFQVPPAVLPLQLDRARLSLQITAAGCVVDLRSAGRDAQPHPLLRRLNNPIGVVELPLAGPTLPELDADGCFALGIDVHPADAGGEAPPSPSWKIDWVQMEVAGIVGDERWAADGR